MLPRRHRLTRPGEFTAVLRGDRGCARPPRAGHRLLVLHARPSDEPRPARLGLVVSSAVGNSVVRHRVSRRLRAVMAPVVASAAPGTDFVIRANPAAAQATSEELRDAVDQCLSRVDRRG